MLIAIEGIDGAGKNTQTQRLKARLEAAGLTVATLSFPRYGETLMAESVADYLNGTFGDIDALPPHFPALLYAADRFESRDLLLDLLALHDVLVIDRYVASNLAHQAAKLPPEARSAFIAWLMKVEYEMYALPKPNVTLYLDLPVATASALIAQKKPRSYTDAAADLHERDLDYLARCRDAYALIGASTADGQWLSIACTTPQGDLRSPSTIGDLIWEALDDALKTTPTEAVQHDD